MVILHLKDDILTPQ